MHQNCCFVLCRCKSRRESALAAKQQSLKAAHDLASKYGLATSGDVLPPAVAEMVRARLRRAEMGLHYANLKCDSLCSSSGVLQPAASTSVKMLHQCFRFQSRQIVSKRGAIGANLRQLAKSLSIIGGSSLTEVIVCNTRRDSMRILDDPARAVREAGGGTKGGGRLRIWPLDSILPGPDKTRQHVAAIQAVGEGGRRWACLVPQIVLTLSDAS